MNLIPTSHLAIIEDEPRVRDLDLAQWLGFTYAPEVRRLIERNREEIEMHGGLCCRNINPGKQGGRPGNAYYLNEGQALVICALSRTPKAAQVRKQLIDVFMAYRAGKVVQVAEHRRRLPNRTKPRDTYDANLSFLRAFEGDREAMLSLMAGMLARLDAIEAA